MTMDGGRATKMTFNLDGDSREITSYIGETGSKELSWGQDQQHEGM